jgi:hypothetical protein
MKNKRPCAALLSVALMLNISTAVPASATDNDDNAQPALCEAAYEYLEQDRGWTRQEVDQMLEAMRTRTYTTYVNDYIFNVYCTSLSGSPTHSFNLAATYVNDYILNWGTVTGGSITNYNAAQVPGFEPGTTETNETLTVNFSSTGKVLTYRLTLASEYYGVLASVPDTPHITLYSWNGGYVTSALGLGNVDNVPNSPSTVIDISDYILLCNYLAEDPNTIIDISVADVDQNGSIGWSDAYQLEDYIMKRINHIWG